MMTRWFAWDAAGRGLPPVSPIVVGSAPWAPEDSEFVRRTLGATALLSLQSDDDLAARGLGWSTLWAIHMRAGLAAERVAIRDFEARDLARHLDAAIAAGERLLAAGHRLYLHCSAGLNRSPTVAVAIRARILGTLDAALSELAAVHPEAVVADDILRKWARKAL
jgi:protein-tyrosine phosphatase